MAMKARMLAFTVGLLSTATATAQDAGPRKVYTSRLSFNLPVRIEDRDRAELKELKFYVKAMNGARPKEWICLETAPPTKAKFAYQAAQDGEYWFTFATVDKTGRVAPTDLDKDAPALIVVVDTHAPEIDVQKMVVASGETYLQCTLKDTNADYTKIKLEAMLPDKSVRTLELMNDTPGVFRIGDPAVLRGFVRATAVDKAGNQAVRDVDLNPAPPPPLIVAAATPILPPPPVATPGVATAPARVVEKSVAPPSAPSIAPAAPTPPSRVLVNNSHCSLDYAVDTPHVTRIEIFATRDGGKTWINLGEDADRRSPADFDLPGDGAWGVTLVIGTINRPVAPPAVGETPDVWIDVDANKPAVQVTDLKLGTGDELGKVSLCWTVADKNLPPSTVKIMCAGQPEGPWQMLAKNRENEGNGKFTLPNDVGSRLFVRVEAVDLAGNVGRWESREPLLLETTRPKVRILGVTAAK